MAMSSYVWLCVAICDHVSLCVAICVSMCGHVRLCVRQ